MKSIYKILIVLSIIFIAFQSCDDDENETKISSYNSDESHRNGQDCMDCHVSGGSGEGWFTVAGTVTYQTLSSTAQQSTVRLYTGPNGTGDLVATVEVDEKGNFYTTKKYDFGTGLYTQVEGNTTTQNMITTISHGRCNSCHGSSTGPIWAE